MHHVILRIAEGDRCIRADILEAPDKDKAVEMAVESYSRIGIVEDDRLWLNEVKEGWTILNVIRQPKQGQTA